MAARGKREPTEARPDSGDDEPTEHEFEDFVTALMKVDPAGLSGKHKAEKEDIAPQKRGRRPKQ